MFAKEQQTIILMRWHAKLICKEHRRLETWIETENLPLEDSPFIHNETLLRRRRVAAPNESDSQFHRSQTTSADAASAASAAVAVVTIQIHIMAASSSDAAR